MSLRHQTEHNFRNSHRINRTPADQNASWDRSSSSDHLSRDIVAFGILEATITSDVERR